MANGCGNQTENAMQQLLQSPKARREALKELCLHRALQLCHLVLWASHVFSRTIFPLTAIQTAPPSACLRGTGFNLPDRIDRDSVSQRTNIGEISSVRGCFTAGIRSLDCRTGELVYPSHPSGTRYCTPRARKERLHMLIPFLPLY